jgi:hypothetical protein
MKMKWGKVIIILLDPDDAVIRRDALAWKYRYKVPGRLCFSIPSCDVNSSKELENFNELKEGCLSLSDLSTKVIIVSHGNMKGVAFNGSTKNPDEFSDYLKLWGLQAAGLLAFRGCLLGRGIFLDSLKTMLSIGGVGVGWLIGYRHEANLMKVTRFKYGLFKTITWHECSGLDDLALRDATSGAQKFPDNERVKIVKGNRNVVPPNGYSRRYSG